MQLKRYVAPGKAQKQSARAVTVEPGTVNENGQQVVRRAGRDAQGMAGQRVYALRCSRCGHEYGEEGIRVHLRKCPKCQGGKPGLPVPEAEPTLFG